MTMRRQLTAAKLEVLQPDAVPCGFSLMHNCGGVVGVIHDGFVSGACFAGRGFGQRQQRSSCRSRIPAQAFTNGFARAFECALVAIELERPVRAEFQRVEFESELSSVDGFVEMAGLLRLDDRAAECRK